MSSPDAAQPPFRLTEQVSVIVCIHDPRRLLLCRTTINEFLRTQSYRNFRILVMNSSGLAVTNRQHPQVVEHVVPSAVDSYCRLLLLGINESRGQWVLPLADDACHHPHRLALQMAHRLPGCCVKLTHQVRADLTMPILCIYHDPAGLASSALFPLERALYKLDTDAVTPDETLRDLAAQFGSMNTVLYDNPPERFPGPGLQIRFRDARSQIDKYEFLGPYSGPEHMSVRPADMSDDLFDYVQASFRVHNLNIEVQ
jgi:hypothetical protein